MSKTNRPLYTEQFGQGESLTLIHGWGAQSAVWRDWAKEYLAHDFKVTLIDLPGFGESAALKTRPDEQLNQAWLNELNQAMPEQTHLLGWSLGGLMAQQLALCYPDKITSLICLASTPRFVQADDWHYGVSVPLMSDFIKTVGLDSAALLKHFWTLQLQGGDGARQLIKHFLSQMENRQLPSLAGLQQGLNLLRDIDMRDKLAQLKSPTLWVLGENDPLIPLAMTKLLLSCQPNAQVAVIEGAAHVPFFSHPDQTADAILSFLKANHGKN
ncbi:pimeloyl-ACP methyl ester esterase BioH [Thiomicrospira sp. R3]|uniref:pimeloyl-ACP methyl ester esterase BioH n=1 Tax=Thiomicrospira sp. R3 TaxID=3035472 RepID=UPI00259B8447|nr:pimeloyl-ACP methyl ester esterase BioH [Thiomicrospira sp. R3]WFE69348.1 pimeloyl-ACP methyl ester esterase BioH [Thiomicrospira sp. R3]